MDSPVSNEGLSTFSSKDIMVLRDIYVNFDCASFEELFSRVKGYLTSSSISRSRRWKVAGDKVNCFLISPLNKTFVPRELLSCIRVMLKSTTSNDLSPSTSDDDSDSYVSIVDDIHLDREIIVLLDDNEEDDNDQSFAAYFPTKLEPEPVPTQRLLSQNASYFPPMSLPPVNTQVFTMLISDNPAAAMNNHTSVRSSTPSEDLLLSGMIPDSKPFTSPLKRKHSNADNLKKSSTARKKSFQKDTTKSDQQTSMLRNFSDRIYWAKDYDGCYWPCTICDIEQAKTVVHDGPLTNKVAVRWVATVSGNWMDSNRLNVFELGTIDSIVLNTRKTTMLFSDFKSAVYECMRIFVKKSGISLSAPSIVSTLKKIQEHFDDDELPFYLMPISSNLWEETYARQILHRKIHVCASDLESCVICDGTTKTARLLKCTNCEKFQHIDCLSSFVSSSDLDGIRFKCSTCQAEGGRSRVRTTGRSVHAKVMNSRDVSQASYFEYLEGARSGMMQLVNNGFHHYNNNNNLIRMTRQADDAGCQASFILIQDLNFIKENYDSVGGVFQIRNIEIRKCDQQHPLSYPESEASILLNSRRGYLSSADESCQVVCGDEAVNPGFVFGNVGGVITEAPSSGLPVHCFRLKIGSGKWMLDAREIGNNMRLVNDYRGLGAEANVDFVEDCQDEACMLKVRMVAKVKIMPGDELLADIMWSN